MDKNEYERTAVALGTFDGLHLGHRAVIDGVLRQKKSGLTACVLLFSEHPLKILKGSAPKKLMTDEARLAVLHDMGCKTLTVDFKLIKDMSAKSFVRDVLIGSFGASFVSCGYNFRFAKNGEGDEKTLARLCREYSIDAYVAPRVDYGGESVSSTRIRSAVERGDMLCARNMLGRPYSYAFTVEHGDERGRTLGFPTVNQFFPSELVIPKYGVYASEVKVGGKVYTGVTNIGVRPTVGGGRPRSETYIIGYEGDLYGKAPEIAPIQYLREETRFDSLEELSRQIEKDKLEALNIAAAQGFGKN